MSKLCLTLFFAFVFVRKLEAIDCYGCKESEDGEAYGYGPCFGDLRNKWSGCDRCSIQKFVGEDGKWYAYRGCLRNGIKDYPDYTKLNEWQAYEDKENNHVGQIFVCDTSNCNDLEVPKTRPSDLRKESDENSVESSIPQKIKCYGCWESTNEPGYKHHGACFKNPTYIWDNCDQCSTQQFFGNDGEWHVRRACLYERSPGSYQFNYGAYRPSIERFNEWEKYDMPTEHGLIYVCNTSRCNDPPVPETRPSDMNSKFSNEKKSNELAEPSTPSQKIRCYGCWDNDGVSDKADYLGPCFKDPVSTNPGCDRCSVQKFIKNGVWYVYRGCLHNGGSKESPDYTKLNEWERYEDESNGQVGQIFVCNTSRCNDLEVPEQRPSDLRKSNELAELSNPQKIQCYVCWENDGVTDKGIHGPCFENPENIRSNCDQCSVQRMIMSGSWYVYRGCLNNGINDHPNFTKLNEWQEYEWLKKDDVRNERGQIFVCNTSRCNDIAVSEQRPSDLSTIAPTTKPPKIDCYICWEVDNEEYYGAECFTNSTKVFSGCDQCAIQHISQDGKNYYFRHCVNNGPNDILNFTELNKWQYYDEGNSRIVRNFVCNTSLCNDAEIPNEKPSLDGFETSTTTTTTTLPTTSPTTSTATQVPKLQCYECVGTENYAEDYKCFNNPETIVDNCDQCSVEYAILQAFGLTIHRGCVNFELNEFPDIKEVNEWKFRDINHQESVALLCNTSLCNDVKYVNASVWLKTTTKSPTTSIPTTQTPTSTTTNQTPKSSKISCYGCKENNKGNTFLYGPCFTKPTNIWHNCDQCSIQKFRGKDGNYYVYRGCLRNGVKDHPDFEVLNQWQTYQESVFQLGVIFVCNTSLCNNEQVVILPLVSTSSPVSTQETTTELMTTSTSSQIKSSTDAYSQTNSSQEQSDVTIHCTQSGFFLFSSPRCGASTAIFSPTLILLGSLTLLAGAVFSMN